MDLKENIIQLYTVYKRLILGQGCRYVENEKLGKDFPEVTERKLG